MVEFAIDLINQIGLLGAGLLIAVEVIIMPIPSEMVLLLTGFNASLGNFSYFGAVAVTTLGSVIGASILYSFGFAFSQARVEAIVLRYGKYVGIKHKDLLITFSWFEKYGSYLVFFGRLFPIVRSLVSIPAGLIKMSVVKFLTFTALGSLLWNSIWIAIGGMLGEQWEKASLWSNLIEYGVYVVFGLAGIWLLVKLWQRRSQRS